MWPELKNPVIIHPCFDTGSGFLNRIYLQLISSGFICLPYSLFHATLVCHREPCQAARFNEPQPVQDLTRQTSDEGAFNMSSYNPMFPLWMSVRQVLPGSLANFIRIKMHELHSGPYNRLPPTTASYRSHVTFKE